MLSLAFVLEGRCEFSPLRKLEGDPSIWARNIRLKAEN